MNEYFDLTSDGSAPRRLLGTLRLLCPALLRAEATRAQLVQQRAELGGAIAALERVSACHC